VVTSKDIESLTARIDNLSTKSSTVGHDTTGPSKKDGINKNHQTQGGNYGRDQEKQSADVDNQDVSSTGGNDRPPTKKLKDGTKQYRTHKEEYAEGETFQRTGGGREFVRGGRGRARPLSHDRSIGNRSGRIYHDNNYRRRNYGQGGGGGSVELSGSNSVGQQDSYGGDEYLGGGSFDGRSDQFDSPPTPTVNARPSGVGGAARGVDERNVAAKDVRKTRAGDAPQNNSGGFTSGRQSDMGSRDDGSQAYRGLDSQGVKNSDQQRNRGIDSQGNQRGFDQQRSWGSDAQGSHGADVQGNRGFEAPGSRGSDGRGPRNGGTGQGKDMRRGGDGPPRGRNNRATEDVGGQQRGSGGGGGKSGGGGIPPKDKPDGRDKAVEGKAPAAGERKDGNDNEGAENREKVEQMVVGERTSATDRSEGRGRGSGQRERNNGNKERTTDGGPLRSDRKDVNRYEGNRNENNDGGRNSRTNRNRNNGNQRDRNDGIREKTDGNRERGETGGGAAGMVTKNKTVGGGRNDVVTPSDSSSADTTSAVAGTKSDSITAGNNSDSTSDLATSSAGVGRSSQEKSVAPKTGR